MAKFEDFKDWKYSCMICMGRFMGKTVVPVSGSTYTRITGEVRATDRAYALKLARRNAINRYKSVIHIVDLVVEEAK